MTGDPMSPKLESKSKGALRVGGCNTAKCKGFGAAAPKINEKSASITVTAVFTPLEWGTTDAKSSSSELSGAL